MAGGHQRRVPRPVGGVSVQICFVTVRIQDIHAVLDHQLPDLLDNLPIHSPGARHSLHDQPPSPGLLAHLAVGSPTIREDPDDAATAQPGQVLR